MLSRLGHTCSFRETLGFPRKYSQFPRTKNMGSLRMCEGWDKPHIPSVPLGQNYAAFQSARSNLPAGDPFTLSYMLLKRWACFRVPSYSNSLLILFPLFLLSFTLSLSHFVSLYFQTPHPGNKLILKLPHPGYKFIWRCLIPDTNSFEDASPLIKIQLKTSHARIQILLNMPHPGFQFIWRRQMLETISYEDAWPLDTNLCNFMSAMRLYVQLCPKLLY